jgi:hypothetical protein
LKKAEQYENILSLEYGISNIDQFITQFCCKIEISIICDAWYTEKKNQVMVLPMGSSVFSVRISEFSIFSKGET